MAYCPKCNQQYDSKFCPKCGYTKYPKTNDNGSCGWGLLGFCVPVAGLVLYLVWKDERPKTAEAVGMGALIYLILLVLLYIFAGCVAMAN